MQAPTRRSAGVWILAVFLSLWVAAPSQSATISNWNPSTVSHSFYSASGDLWTVSHNAHGVMLSGHRDGEDFAFAFDGEGAPMAASDFLAGDPYPVEETRRPSGTVVPEPSAALLTAFSLLAVHLRTRRR